jgi:carboxymethylenebutenolidase
MSSYLARPPAGTDTGLGVIVGFEMFGVTGYVRRVADRIAALGHTALVPDFYHRFGDDLELPTTPEGREQGLGLLKQIDRPMVEADVDAAMRTLTDTDRIAAFGISAGGHFLYYAATQLPIDTLVALYPGWLTGAPFPFAGPEPTITLPLLASRTLILTGADDHLLDASVRAALETRAELVVYPGTPHGYFCDERDTYRAGPAADTWARVTREFAGTASYVHTCDERGSNG